jgi:hypothetical protein
MPPRTRRINRMKRQGMTQSQILDALNGENNQRNLAKYQLEAIGFGGNRVDKIMDRQRAGKQTWGTKPSGGDTGDTGGGRAGGGRGAAPEDELPPISPDPFDPSREAYEDAKREQRESAFSMMSTLLEQYGLGSLGDYLKGLITDGVTDAASLQLRLQETKEWKTRFRGNELLKQQGLGVLSPAEYLNLEKSYASVMRQFGLPPGFYDKTDDFVKFIGNNVSPQELSERAGMATDLAKQVDPTQRETLRSFYGIGEGDLAAYFLDPKKAQPLLQKQLNAVKIAGAGKRAGLDVGDKAERFEDMADRGVTEQMAQQGYGNIANEIDPLKNLASIWGRGDDWTLGDAEQATFFNDATARRERRGLIDRERAAFSGRSGFQSGVSGRRSTAGSF